MNGEEKLWAIGWISLATFLIVLTLSLTIKFHLDNVAAFKYGYERVQSYGEINNRWVKVQEKGR